MDEFGLAMLTLLYSLPGRVAVANAAAKEAGFSSHSVSHSACH